MNTEHTTQVLIKCRPCSMQPFWIVHFTSISGRSIFQSSYLSCTGM